MKEALAVVVQRGAALARRAGSWLGPRLPDFQDLNLYGGVLLVALGVADLTERAWGFVVGGAALFYLGMSMTRNAIRRIELLASRRDDREAA